MKDFLRLKVSASGFGVELLYLGAVGMYFYVSGVWVESPIHYPSLAQAPLFYFKATKGSLLDAAVELVGFYRFMRIQEINKGRYVWRHMAGVCGVRV